MSALSFSTHRCCTLRSGSRQAQPERVHRGQLCPSPRHSYSSNVCRAMGLLVHYSVKYGGRSAAWAVVAAYSSGSPPIVNHRPGFPGLQSAVALASGTLCALSAWLLPMTLPVAVAVGLTAWVLVRRFAGATRKAGMEPQASTALSRQLSGALGRPIGLSDSPAPLAEQALSEYALLRSAACAAILSAGVHASPNASTAELARTLRTLSSLSNGAAARSEAVSDARRARAAEARAKEELAVARGQARMLASQRDAACAELAALQVESERQLDEYDTMVESLEDQVEDLEAERQQIVEYLTQSGQLGPDDHRPSKSSKDPVAIAGEMSVS